jgi:3-oxoacyl-[acyl-carrier protein] reductase
MNKYDLTGKNALITGASSGIGRAAAVALAECGADIGINYFRNQTGAEECAAEVTALGRRAALIKADVSHRSGVEQLIAAAHAQLGSIDILVNNAGDLIERCRIEDFTDDLWDRVMDLNLRSVYLCSQAVMPEMIERKQGNIIIVGSIAGRNGGGPGAAVYSAAKAGAMCLTKGLAKELARHGIRVNGVAPGVIATPFHERLSTPQMLAQFVEGIPLGRLGTAEECGSVIAFLASGASSYLDGEMIEINGGQLML